MNLLKKIYTEGDDEMKRTLNKAWTESQDKEKRQGDMMDFWTAAGGAAGVIRKKTHNE